MTKPMTATGIVAHQSACNNKTKSFELFAFSVKLMSNQSQAEFARRRSFVGALLGRRLTIELRRYVPVGNALK